MAHVATPLTGIYGSATAVGSVNFTFSSAVSTGHTLIGAVNTTQASTTPVFTVSDSKGNTYSVDMFAVSSTTDEMAVFSAHITTALTTSDTMTISVNDGTHTRWVVSVEEFDDILTSPLDKTAKSTGTSTSSMTSTATATTTAANELVFGGFGFTNGATRTFVAGAGFTNSPQIYTNVGSSDRVVCNEWQYVNSTGAQTATATLTGGTSTWAAIVATYKSQVTGNNAPTANAGVDQTVAAQQLVTLNGTASSDSDGTIAGYSWTQLSGTTVTLSSTSVAQPTFVAPASASGATLVFGLVVTDNAGADSTQDTVTITVNAAVGHVATPIAGALATSSASSHAFSVSQAVVAGHYLVGGIATDYNTGTAQPILSVSDSKGNTYTVDTYVAASSTVFVAVFSGRLTTALTTSDTLTVTDSSANTRTRWVASVEEYDNLIYPAAPLDQIVSNTARTTSMTTTASATTTAANELVFATFGYAVPSTQTFTVGSGYTASSQQATANGTNDRALANEWRTVNATGAQTATATISVLATYGAALATYKCINITGNTPPTANAGSDQSVTVSTTVTLDGSASSDPDGTIASYSWRQISGATVTLSSTTAQKPTFTAPGSSATLVFGLTVTDNNGASSPEDTVTILVGSHAGYVAEAVFGTKTSSGNSFTLTFNKAISSGHTLLVGVAVDTTNGAGTLTATDSKGNTYTNNANAISSTTAGVTIFSAYITAALTTSDTLTITDSTVTHSRWAVSGSEFDNLIQNGFDVKSTGTGHSVSPSSGSTAATQNTYEVVYGAVAFGRSSSQNFTPASGYALATQVNTAAGSSDRSMASMYRYFSASSTFAASGVLTATSTWAAAVATYTATSLGNLPPTANAGPAQSVAPFVTVTLDGTGSSDPDGVISTYAWTQTGGTTVTLSSTSAAQPTFTAPGVDGGTTLTFSLTVTDNSNTTSNASTVTVTVSTATEFVVKSGTWQAAQVYDAQSGSWV